MSKIQVDLCYHNFFVVFFFITSHFTKVWEKWLLVPMLMQRTEQINVNDVILFSTRQIGVCKIIATMIIDHVLQITDCTRFLPCNCIHSVGAKRKQLKPK